MNRQRQFLAALLLCAANLLGQTADVDPDQTPRAPQSGGEAKKEQTAPAPDPSKRGFLKEFAVDEWRMWSSPFRRSSYDGNTVKKYVIPFALISTGLIASDRKTIKVLPNTKDQAVWSGRVSQLGAAYTVAGAAGGMYLLGKMVGNDHARETGWISLEALAHTQLVVFGIKQVTNRRRPITDDTKGAFWNGGDSFPSGHAATSFAIATVFAYEYRHHIAVPIGAYALAALVSASRVSARRHWASDIFVGGSTGFLIGRYVYKRRHNPDLPGSAVGPRSRASLLTPDVGFGAGGVSLSWKL